MNKQLALAIQLNQEATLADFNWTSNTLLRQQILTMLAEGQEKFLYLWGTKGSGKSHLLQACCQAVNAGQSAIYLPLKLLKEWGPQTLESLEKQDLICLDDLEVIAGDMHWEEALFHLYNKIKDSDHGLCILSGENSPAALSLKLPDLVSRIGGALVFQLHELSDEEKIKALRLHAHKRGFDLTEQVSQFLLTRCSRNMQDLQQLLNTLDQASLEAQRKITIPFVKEILHI